MPGSFRHFDALIGDRIGLDFPNRDIMILDVGAGAGKYRDILHDYSIMHAVEAHGNYIGQFDLRKRYEQVFNYDITEYMPWRAINYDLIIFGDVIEHMTVAEAQCVLTSAMSTGAAVLVAVPYEYKQDAVAGVMWEIHKQPDLTHEKFMALYPGFDCLVRDEKYGIYVHDHCEAWSENEVPEEDDQHVSISIPTGDWKVYVHCLTSCWDVQQHHLKNGLCPLTLQTTNGASVEKSRNISIAKALAYEDITHLLFVDSDEGWPKETIQRLLAHKAQVVGVPIRLKTQTPTWNIRELDENTGALWDGQRMKIGGIGTGLLLVARTAIERMLKAYPKLAVNPGEGLPNYSTLFQTTEISEDYTFCKRWRDIGGYIWADPSIEVCHVGLTEYTGSFIETFDKPGATADQASAA